MNPLARRAQAALTRAAQTDTAGGAHGDVDLAAGENSFAENARAAIVERKPLVDRIPLAERVELFVAREVLLDRHGGSVTVPSVAHNGGAP